MILVDTSVWIDFFRNRPGTAGLEELLETHQIILHPWVLGELSLGHLGAARTSPLPHLALLPQTRAYPDTEILAFIKAGRLAGLGLGWVDIHLLYTAITEEHALWTHDQNLRKAAVRHHVAWPGA